MNVDRLYLEMAMEEAGYAYKDRTYPVGSVIIGPSGQLIGRGHNSVYSEGDFTSHAEIKAIGAAGSRLMLSGNFENCTLYTTMEPCLMCCGAILLARIARVVWVRDDDLHGALRCLHYQTHPLSKIYEEKLHGLEIAACGEDDLRQKMETWMDEWNGQKEAVLKPWRSGKRETQCRCDVSGRKNEGTKKLEKEATCIEVSRKMSPTGFVLGTVLLPEATPEAARQCLLRRP